MEKIIEVKNLQKSYKNNKALDGLSFDLYEGEILGILGPNGAGKSTTINILSTILKKDAGEILYFGKPMEKNEKEIKFCHRQNALKSKAEEQIKIMILRCHRGKLVNTVKIITLKLLSAENLKINAGQKTGFRLLR